MLKPYLPLLICIMAFQCNSPKQVNESAVKENEKAVSTIAKEQYGSDFQILYNKPKDFVILSKAYKRKASDPFPTMRFQILRCSDREVLFRDAVPAGSVQWEDDQVVHVRSKQGIPDPETGKPKRIDYRYNVETQKKYSGNFFKGRSTN